MQVLELNESNFKEFTSGGVVVVDFYANWCGPCKMLSPILHELAEEGVINVGKVNVDENEAIAMAFNVSSIPYLVLFKDGKVVSTSLGFKPKNMLLKWINEAN